MSEPGDGDIFDLEQLKRLIELMEEHDLGEVELENAGRRVRLQRGGVAPLSAPAPVVATAPAVAATESSAEPDHIVYIRSPMVGSFYSKPNPESPSYVKIGDHVDPETTVCMVEAMKNFIPIPADVRGEIVAVLVEDGDPVDHDKPLFKVDTSR